MGILEGNSSNILRVEQNLWYIEDWRYPAIEKVTLSGSLQTQHKECIRVMNLFLIPNRDDYYEALRHFLIQNEVITKSTDYLICQIRSTDQSTVQISKKYF